MAYSYTCKEYPGMETCPGKLYTETEEELWKLIELHAVLAHKEDPNAWSSAERAQVKALIKNTNAENTS